MRTPKQLFRTFPRLCDASWSLLLMNIGIFANSEISDFDVAFMMSDVQHAPAITPNDVTKLMAKYLIPNLGFEKNAQSLTISARAELIRACVAAGIPNTAAFFRKYKSITFFVRLHMTGTRTLCRRCTYLQPCTCTAVIQSFIPCHD